MRVWLHVACVAVITALAAPGLARQPQIDSLVTELTATERRAADKSASLREREQAVDKAMELRKRVIAASGTDEARLPGWLMDQAAAELARLARDGSDTAAIFAIPLPAQLDTVRESSDRALQLLSRAGSLLEARYKALAASGAPAEDPRLVQLDQDKSVRVPFFTARARVLVAACSTGKERSQNAQSAFDAIGKLSLASAGPESTRRISLGAALLMRSEPPDEQDVRSAIEEFGWVLTGGSALGGPGGVSGPARAEAWFGLILAGAGLGKLDTVLEQFRGAMMRDPFVTDGRADALLTVLGADAITRGWAEQGFRSRDRSKLDLAVAEQQALLRRTDLGVRVDSLRPLAFQKLYLVAARWGAVMDLPPAMDLAGAIDAARDPKRRDEAIKRLRAVADSPDAGDFAGDALWEAAVLLTQGAPTPADRLAAGQLLTRLAKDFPQNPKAGDAIGAALAYLQSLSREASDPGSSGAYLAALAVATVRLSLDSQHRCLAL